MAKLWPCIAGYVRFSTNFYSGQLTHLFAFEPSGNHQKASHQGSPPAWLVDWCAHPKQGQLQALCDGKKAMKPKKPKAKAATAAKKKPATKKKTTTKKVSQCHDAHLSWCSERLLPSVWAAIMASSPPNHLPVFAYVFDAQTATKKVSDF